MFYPLLYFIDNKNIQHLTSMTK